MLIYLCCDIEKEIPRDVFIKYRNENMKKNFISEIALVDPQAAMALGNAHFNQIQNFVKQYNDTISAQTGQ